MQEINSKIFSYPTQTVKIKSNKSKKVNRLTLTSR